MFHAETLVTKAAKMKPDAEWRDYPTWLVNGLPGYQPTVDSERSLYGGVKPDPRKGSGFFSTEKKAIDGG